MPRGGYREGAGRPPTLRRITLDAEAAEQLRALLAKRRADEPRAHWTAGAVVGYLITEAFRRERPSTDQRP